MNESEINRRYVMSLADAYSVLTDKRDYYESMGWELPKLDQQLLKALEDIMDDAVSAINEFAGMKLRGATDAP